MKHIDMHCDTLMVSLFKDENKNLDSLPFAMLDFNRMKKAGQMAQFFAAFLPTQDTFKRFNTPIMSDEDYIKACYEILINNVNKHNDKIAMAYNVKDIEDNYSKGLMSAIFTLEDGRSVDGKLENLKRYHDDYGVRAISLTWNSYNCFGAPNSKNPLIMYDGLTAFGFEAVKYMQEIGILVDVSHLSEGGFFGVLSISKKPFVATHSNSRVLSSHQRNLSDDQLRALASIGGVTGINFGPSFLNEDITNRNSTVAAMVRHIKHISNVSGIDSVALGTDFDGVGGNLEIDSVDKMYLLEEALRKDGFSESDLEKFFYKNILRVLKESIK